MPKNSSVKVMLITHNAMKTHVSVTIMQKMFGFIA